MSDQIGDTFVSGDLVYRDDQELSGYSLSKNELINIQSSDFYSFSVLNNFSISEHVQPELTVELESEAQISNANAQAFGEGVVEEIQINDGAGTFIIPILEDYGQTSVVDFYVKDAAGNEISFASLDTTAQFLSYSRMYAEVDDKVSGLETKDFPRSYIEVWRENSARLQDEIIKDSNAEKNADAFLLVAGLTVAAVATAVTPAAPLSPLLLNLALTAGSSFFAVSVSERNTLAKISQLKAADTLLDDSLESFFEARNLLNQSELSVADIKSAYQDMITIDVQTILGQQYIQQIDSLDPKFSVFGADYVDFLSAGLITIGATPDKWVPLLDEVVNLGGHAAAITKYAGVATAGLSAGIVIADAYLQDQNLQNNFEKWSEDLSAELGFLAKYENGYDPSEDDLAYFKSLLSLSPDVGSGIDDAQAIDSTSLVVGDLNTGVDSDWFSLSVSSGERIEVTLDPQNQFVPILVLRDENGVLVRELIGKQSDQAVLLKIPSVGEWYLEVKSVSGGGGDYSLSLDSYETTVTIFDDSVPDAVPGDVTTNASIADGQTIEGVIEYSGDQDWYEISLSSDRIYTFDLEGEGSASGSASARALERPVLYLMNGNDEVLIGATSASSGGDARFTYIPDFEGIHYLNVQSLLTGNHFGFGENGYVSGFGKFRLSVDSLAAPAPLADNVGDSEATASELQVGDRIFESLSDRSDDDFYKLFIEAGHTYRVEVNPADLGAGVLTNPDLDVLTVPADTVEATGTANGNPFAIVSSQLGGWAFFRVEWANEWIAPGSYEITVAETGTPEDEATSDITTNAIASIGGNSNGGINFEGDTDWWRLNLNPSSDSVGGNYTSYLFEVNDNDGSNVDVDARFLFDANGELIDNERTWTFEETGPLTAFLEIGVDPSELNFLTGGYTLNVVAYADDYGQSEATAGILPVGGSINGVIEEVSTPSLGNQVEDTDYFSMELLAGHRYKITKNDFDLILRIRTDLPGDNDLTQVENDNEFFFVPSVSGTYYLEVDESNTAGNYTLSLSDESQSDDFSSSVDENTGFITTINVDPFKSGDFPVDEEGKPEGQGVLEVQGDADWFEVSLVAGNIYRVHSKSLEDTLDNSATRIRDSEGNLIPESSVNGNLSEESDDKLFFTDSTSTYYIEVFARGRDITPSKPGIGEYGLVVDQFTVAGELAPGEPSGLLIQYNDEDPSDKFRQGERFYEIDLEAGNEYQFTFNSSFPDRLDLGDIELYAGSGADIDTYNRFGSGQATSGYTVRIESSGTYFILAESQTKDELDGQSVQVIVSSGAQYDDHLNNENTSSAISFTGNTATVSGSVDYATNTAIELNEDDSDWFQITLLAGKTYSFIDNNAYGSLKLVDASTNRLLWESSDSEQFESGSLRDAYLVVSAGEDDTATGIYDFGFSVTTTESVPDASLLVDDIIAGLTTLAQFSTPAGLPEDAFGIFESSFEAQSDQDWVNLTLENDTSYYFEVSDQSVSVALKGANGQSLSFSEPGVLEYYSLSQQSAFLEISAVSDVLGPYSVLGYSRAGFNLSPTIDGPSIIRLESNDNTASLGLSAPADPEGDAFTTIVTELPKAGSIKLNGEEITVGTEVNPEDFALLTYQREAGRYGDVGTFSYEVRDFLGASRIGTVSIEAAPTLDDPAAAEVIYTAVVSDTSSIGAPGVANGLVTLNLKREVFSNSDTSIDWYIHGNEIVNGLSINGVSLEAVSQGTIDFRAGEILSEFFFSVNLLSPDLPDQYQLMTLTNLEQPETLRIENILISNQVFFVPSDPSDITAFVTNDLVIGGDNSDILKGMGGDDILVGNAGRDELLGGAGNDELDGGAGSDHLFGELGDDTLSGNGGDDQLFGQDGADVLSGGGGRDFLDGGFGNDEIIGGDGRDTIFGGIGDDVISGRRGSDFIDAGSGNDIVSGRGLSDNIFGGDGNDVLRGNGGTDTIHGEAGNDLLIGGQGDDILFGGDNDDVLDGRNGNDILSGGSGNDTLTGKSGADTFVFEEGHEQVEVTDFKDDEDTLDLSSYGFSSVSQAIVLMSEVNGDVLFVSSEDTLTLRNITITELQDDIVV